MRTDQPISLGDLVSIPSNICFTCHETRHKIYR